MLTRTVQRQLQLICRARACRPLRFSTCASASLHDHPHFFLLPNAISEEEEQALVAYLDPLLRRKRYEGDHWDSVIVQYKEAELRPISARGVPMPPLVAAVLSRLHKVISANYRFPVPELQLPHAIDLSREGFIGYHIDNVRHSGGVLAGLSLLSTRTMRLRRQQADSARDMLGPQAGGTHAELWAAADVAVLRRHAATSETGWAEAAATELNGVDKDKKLLRSAEECRLKYHMLTQDTSAGAAGRGKKEEKEEKEEEEVGFDHEVQVCVFVCMCACM